MTEGNSQQNNTEKSSYTAKDITVLASLEAIRKRPGMYIGSTGVRGLHHLVYELIDNAIDEAMAGYCDKIKVVIHKNGKVSVIDNGRGIPVDNHPKYNRPALEIILTHTHSGGKFDKNTYKVSGGPHIAGVSVVKAVAKDLDAYGKTANKIYHQKYSR